MNKALSAALGRLATDSNMLALFMYDPDRALADVKPALSPEDRGQLQTIIARLQANSQDPRSSLAKAMRAADRVIE